MSPEPTAPPEDLRPEFLALVPQILRQGPDTFAACHARIVHAYVFAAVAGEHLWVGRLKMPIATDHRHQRGIWPTPLRGRTHERSCFRSLFLVLKIPLWTVFRLAGL